MLARGRVQNGVVVLADGVRLPEGQDVTVLASGMTLEDRSPEIAQQDQESSVGENNRTGSLRAKAHSILDIPPVSLGPVVHPFTANDDLLGEMLEGR
jgi:hypothetical protein